jgi:hypothetical protein
MRSLCRTLPLATLVLTVAIVCSSCAGADQQGSEAHRMAVWVNGTNLGQDVGALVADNARVPKVVANGSGALHAACATLITDAEMANGQLPSPDPEVTDMLTQAYNLEGTAGNQCYDAGSTDKTLLSRSARNAIKAEALYAQALQRIRQIDGKSVSTTTTTEGNTGGGIFG